MSRDRSTACSMAWRVISWNTIRRVGTAGFSTSARCRAMASPSQSSSVAKVELVGPAQGCPQPLDHVGLDGGTT